MTLSAEVRAALADPPEGVTVTITDGVPFPGTVEVRVKDAEGFLRPWSWPADWAHRWRDERLAGFARHSPALRGGVIVLGRAQPQPEGEPCGKGRCTGVLVDAGRGISDDGLPVLLSECSRCGRVVRREPVHEGQTALEVT